MEIGDRLRSGPMHHHAFVGLGGKYQTAPGRIEGPSKG